VSCGSDAAPGFPDRVASERTTGANARGKFTVAAEFFDCSYASRGENRLLTQSIASLACLMLNKII
jgi:hypothetical protein